MEREHQNQLEFKGGETDRRIDPAILTLIVRQEINAILEACERQNYVNNMNA